MDWACINSVGWLIARQEGYDTAQYEQSARELYFDAQEDNAAGEDWELTEDVAGDLWGWYEDDNAFAVDAFVEVNDCINRTADG